PHPELFLEYPRGLGMDLARFESIELLPAAAHFRATIDAHTTARGWDVAAAVTTIFLEGTPYDRSALDPTAPKRPEPPLEEHLLVKHYGLAVAHLALTKAHRGVEGDHRASAWHVMLDHVDASRRPDVVAAMEETLTAWLAYRDDVAAACAVAK